jgi:DNA-binding SARP family transcriptional activator
LTLEDERASLDETMLPARQGRLAFAYLVLERRRPVPRRELATAIWGDEPPEGWDAGLSVLLSRLRRVFRAAGVNVDIATLSGTVSLRLPASTWVDMDAARSAIDEAEGALRSGDPGGAWTQAAVACSIAERGFLHGDDQTWVLRQREHLRAEAVRSLECLADASLALADYAGAVRYARQCSELEPFRESAYEREMRAHIGLGNRAEALRVYERVRLYLADELGADPSPQIQAVYLEALGDRS